MPYILSERQPVRAHDIEQGGARYLTIVMSMIRVASRHLRVGIKCVSDSTAKSSHAFKRKTASLRNGCSFHNGFMLRCFSSSPAETNASESATISFADTSLSASTPANLETIALAAAPLEKTGLTEVGLVAPDTGYSATHFVMQAVDQVHLIGGLPYWEAIIISTLALRLILLPSAVWVARDISQMKALRPEVKKIKESFGGVTSAEDPTLRYKFVAKVQELFSIHSVNPFRTAALSIIQLPVFLSIFIGLRKMGDYYPEFSTGGALWFHDLSSPDPYLILPVVNAMTFLVMVEVGTASLSAEHRNLKLVRKSSQLFRYHHFVIACTKMDEGRRMLPFPFQSKHSYIFS